ncbi:glucose/arabinose dehydrogenase [Altererythrobacter atlanticus]|uniref:Membrane bound L-sorbosone dehydrogenase n=1 Tax=Croceibacterium atlanticum TaxID=1267766 RepID=A0A0F7KUP7_9SPHN|nr:sorbosone dehydrogenase family protein [Croceibacterium atlanticum]AKH43344.1 Membrane bound L-sorbosone dehydrogenase [Croceibacterium atlanticum]MBB5731950.1 glucose/arabinose dehydrogenase [Croceibacterium atlanticum]
MSILKKIGIGLLVVIVLLVGAGWWVLRGDPAEYSVEDVTGTDPLLAEPDPQTIPTVAVAKPVGWGEDGAPQAAEGLQVNRFAAGLEHPRIIYAMPNGDIIVAESNAPERVVAGGGITNFIAGILFSRAGASVPSPDKLVLLRDADGDGVAEGRHVLRDDLSSPSGIAWREGKLYVANHDAVLRFDYAEGDKVITGKPEKLMDLPAAGNHWMRNLVLSPDGKNLYVAVGSASNIGEGGMEAEQGRAAIHELHLETGSSRIYAAGLRNPNGLDWNPWTGELWTTVNERDMLGSDLVPDYLTNVPIGVNYGWPWLYWNEEVDERVEAPMPLYLTDYARTPEYALGPHVAALGLVFTEEGARMPEKFSHGAFIARHGSWNRKPAAGYDLVYVPFDERGNPTGKPVPVLQSFLAGDGETHGRPTWVAWDKTGALLLSDDTANIIWRISAPDAAAASAQIRNTGNSLPPRRQLDGDPARAFDNPPADLLPGSF